jgi:replicative DNA helicase
LSLDLTVLRLLKYKEKYDRLIKAVPAGAVEQRTAIILDDFGRWFREHDGASRIDFSTFPFMFQKWHPTLKPEAMAVYEHLFNDAQIDVAEHIEGGLAKQLVAAEMATKMTKALESYAAGEEIDLGVVVKSAVENYEQQFDRKVKNPQVLDPIEDLLAAEENDVGLHFRLDCLNNHIKPLVGGDFVVIAMRPDKGKTTLCASEVTFMAPQVDQIYPGEKRSILWFNNEGPGRRIITRNFQAALGATVEEMVELNKQPAAKGFEKYKTLLRQKYVEALGGRPGVLRVFDIHGMWNYEVEDLMRLYTPALVVFDMVDNIKFGGETNNNGQRTDQLLEAMYQWARFMGVKYDCAVIANSQISADGDGMQYPTLPMLKDSKTGKQGAADVIITGGAVNDSMLANSRYIGTTKNKKVRTGQRSSPNCEVMLVGDRARYVESPK